MNTLLLFCYSLLCTNLGFGYSLFIQRSTIWVLILRDVQYMYCLIIFSSTIIDLINNFFRIHQEKISPNKWYRISRMAKNGTIFMSLLWFSSRWSGPYLVLWSNKLDTYYNIGKAIPGRSFYPGGYPLYSEMKKKCIGISDFLSLKWSPNSI